MRELSEKEMEELYKNAKLTEIPDMWDEIERNLAPKKKKKSPMKWIAPITSLAAVMLLVLVLIPVIGRIGVSNSKDMAMENVSGEQSEGTAEEIIGDQSVAENETAGDRFNEAEDSNPQQEMMIGTPPLYSQDNVGSNNNVWIATVKILALEETEQGLEILAEVIEEKEDISIEQNITIYYEDDTYEKQAFQGILTIKIEENEKKLKLLEILP